ncbi:hypothetical protein B0H10DRAFT_1952747 [Mycena sp. CBHHK59/15]|nr:hypothetical protein B0H10DRAFT_1952747 [Mycena sp. CBHHK59/15]
MWKFHRDLTRPFFDNDSLSDFDRFDTRVEDAISQMKTRLREGYAFDFQVWLPRGTSVSANTAFRHTYWSSQRERNCQANGQGNNMLQKLEVNTYSVVRTPIPSRERLFRRVNAYSIT